MSCFSSHHSLLKHLSAAVPHWLCGDSEEMFTRSRTGCAARLLLLQAVVALQRPQCCEVDLAEVNGATNK